jgi:uncharacterized membrane protein
LLVAPAALWCIGWLAEIGLGGLAVWLAGRHGPALLGVLVNLAVVMRFVVTLRPGRVPLITRYANHDEAGPVPQADGYTRALTAAWALLLGGFAALHAGAMLDLWASGDVALAQGAAVALLFLGEHWLRGRLFPGLGRFTPLRTFRAIRRSIGAQHAA